MSTLPQTQTRADQPNGPRRTSSGRAKSALQEAAVPFVLGAGEEPVNGLVVRPNQRGTFMLVLAETGQPVLRDAQNGMRGGHATPQSALEWARVTYPLILRVTGRVRRRYRARLPRCDNCQIDMTQELRDERRRPNPVWTCPTCNDTRR